MMNMTVQKLFWDDPYLSEIKTTVKSINGDIITVDRTIAYAFAGGQQSDSGKIGEFEILNARKDGTEIYYTIEPEHTLKVDDIVTMKIDWNKRYRIMRLHFAAELVLELVYQNFNQPQKIGANITDEKARVDFDWNGNISEIFPFLYEQLSKLVEDNLDIVSDFSNVESERRYWEIAGFAKVKCGGTHIKKTGEVGSLKLKRVNPGGGKERIEIYLLD
jgi:Ser-tRNA(Ala) deacylase AlaX